MEQHGSEGQQEDWLQGATVEAQCTIDERIEVPLDGFEFGTDDNNVS